METAAKTGGSKARKLRKPNNIVKVPVKEGQQGGFFRWWCVFLRPFISLTERETDVVAEFLRQRWELSKVVNDQALLDEMLMSDAVRRKVRENCKVTQQFFYGILSNLRKSGVIVNNRLDPRLIPNIRQDDNGCFQLLILFTDEDRRGSAA